ncbi:MAG: hypothetical protein R2844_01550 [Caldilineales bacterium]
MRVRTVGMELHGPRLAAPAAGGRAARGPGGRSGCSFRRGHRRALELPSITPTTARALHDAGRRPRPLSAPGSSGLNVFDRTTGALRPARTADFVDYVRLADGWSTSPILRPFSDDARSDCRRLAAT